MRDNLDTIIEEVVKEHFDELPEFKEIDIPPSEEMLNRVYDRAHNMNEVPKRGGRALKIAGLIVALIVITFIMNLIFTPQMVSAWRYRAFEFFVNEDPHGGIAFGGNNTGDQGDFEDMEDINKAVDSVRDKVPFDIFIPAFIPDGYKFQDIEVTGSDNDVNIYIYYTSSDGGWLWVRQDNMPNDIVFSMTNTEEIGSVEPVALNHTEGMIVVSDSSTHLVWSYMGINYEIHGSVPPDEIINMAMLMNQ